MDFRLDKGTGYMYSYQPSHYCANKAGKVLEHVLVMSEAIGRMLCDDECVHHKDRNRANNELENLMLLTNPEHAKLHQMEDNGVVFITVVCSSCKNSFLSTGRNKQKFALYLAQELQNQSLLFQKNDLNFLCGLS